MCPQSYIIIADTSVLINFLHILRTDLFSKLSSEIVITDHVFEEITNDYPDQKTELDIAISQGFIRVQVINLPEEVALFNILSKTGRIGLGECSAIAHAIISGHALAMNDRRAKTVALKESSNLLILKTQDLIVQMINENIINVNEADAFKHEWENKFRFPMSFSSFCEII